MAKKLGKLRTEAREGRMSKALRDNLKRRKAAARKQGGERTRDKAEWHEDDSTPQK